MALSAFSRTGVLRFFGNTISEAAAFGAGVAIGPVLAPATEKLRQEAWSKYATRIPSAAELAAGVSQRQVDEGQAREWARANGFGDTSFDALVSIANTGPDVATAMQSWRRGKLTEPEFRTVLRRHAIETQWDASIEALKAAILDPGELARAIHRGLVPDPGLLQGRLPAGPGNVPAYPVYPIDALQEAEGSGYDRERLGVLVGLQGLPMGPHEAAQAVFRGILTEDDYLRAIAEGNTRNEWADAIMEQSRQIPTARDFFENALRGYHDLPWAMGQAKRHGMSDADALVIYQNQGRPMNVHAITTALARGGKFKPEPGEITDPYDAAIVEGNLKPAYYGLAKANRYSLPSYFVFRALIQNDTLTEAEGADYFRQIGWPPELADAAAKVAAGSGGGATTNPRVKRAQDQVYNATHSSYLDNEIDRPKAIASLEHIGLSAATAGQVVDLWEFENDVLVKPLSPANVKKGYKAGDFTIDEATARLVNQQWSAGDANVYLTT